VPKHYTKKFKAAYDRVLQAIEEHGEAAGQLAFRNEMLKLGHDERVRNLYRIKDKLTTKPVIFRPNKHQERYTKERSGRDIILKIRQVGFTTISAVRWLDYALWQPNWAGGIMAHQQDAVKDIFQDKLKFSYDWFKKDWGHLYKLVEKSDNATELFFKQDSLGRILNSSVRVAYNFRSKTLNGLHVSEAAFISDERLKASLQCVPVSGEVIFESTAKGMGGEFYRVWNLTRELKQQAPYKGFFIPWFEFYPEDPKDPRWQLADDAKLTDYENWLLESFDNKIQRYHIAWRRWCISANCQGNVEAFDNEYPSNDLDCFIGSENSIFSATLIKMQRKNCREATQVGFLVAEDKKIRFYDDSKGYTSLWTKPNPASTYVIGADPAGGVGRDKGAAYVKDQHTQKTVARIWSDLEPAEFAKELYKLGSYYNKAWICVEANNHGAVVIHVLKEMGYYNLYKRHAIDEMTQRPTKKIGFLTTTDKKILLTENFKNAAKQGDFIITDSDLIKEMTTFMQFASKTGRSFKREAQSGCHDDLVIAAALAQEMDSARPKREDARERLSCMPEDHKVDEETGF